MTDDTLLVGMIEARTGPYVAEEKRVEAPLEALVQAIEEHPELDILLAPEWYFMSDDQWIQSSEEYASIVSRLEVALEGKEMLVIPGSIAHMTGPTSYRNTAPVIIDGETVMEYDKREIGGDRFIGRKMSPTKIPWSKDRIRWEKGEESGVFDWRGYKVGLEICNDHKYGALRTQDEQRDLDLQIVVSHGMTLDAWRFAIHEGGRAMVSDGYSAYGDIQDHAGRNVDFEPPAEPDERHSISKGADLTVYHMEAPR